jgi:hypothetical protein
VFGGAGNDVVWGEDGRDHLDGGAGDDEMDGGAGSDVITDGPGSDIVRGAGDDDVVVAAVDADDDVFLGGEGKDTLSFAEFLDSLLIDAEAGTASAPSPDAATGTDRFSGFEKIIAGFGDDTVKVGAAPLAVAGGQGCDAFEFVAAGSENTRAQCVHEILDLEVGDRIVVDGYEIRTRDGLPDTPGDDAGDNAQFEWAYGEGEKRTFRFQAERKDERDYTRIEMFDASGDAAAALLTIDVQGNHHLYVLMTS